MAAIRIVLVQGAEALHIRIWNNVGNLPAGEHYLYPAADVERAVANAYERGRQHGPAGGREGWAYNTCGGDAYENVCYLTDPPPSAPHRRNLRRVIVLEVGPSTTDAMPPVGEGEN